MCKIFTFVIDYHLSREFDYFKKYTFPTLLLQGALDPAQPPHYFDGTGVLTCGYTISFNQCFLS
jgi:hypothetical protein